MATMMGIKIPAAETPNNPVSVFVDKEIDLLLPPGGDTGITDMIKGVYIAIVNRDPNAALQTLVTIHNDIGELVRTLQAPDQIDDATVAQLGDNE